MTEKISNKQQLIEQYKRERNRVKRAYKRLEKQGYKFDSNPIPDKPKRITQGSIRRLQAITPKSMREKATFVLPETGEIVEGPVGAGYLRRKAAKKGVKTRKINAALKAQKREVTPLSETPTNLLPYAVGDEAADAYEELVKRAMQGDVPVDLNTGEILHAPMVEDAIEEAINRLHAKQGYPETPPTDSIPPTSDDIPSFWGHNLDAFFEMSKSFQNSPHFKELTDFVNEIVRDFGEELAGQMLEDIPGDIYGWYDIYYGSQGEATRFILQITNKLVDYAEENSGANTAQKYIKNAQEIKDYLDYNGWEE